MLNSDLISGFARELYASMSAQQLTITPLRGGLECSGIARVIAREPNGRSIGSFVVKPIAGSGLRELTALRNIQRLGGGAVSPRLLGARRSGTRQAYVFLEWVRGRRTWPWRDAESSGVVLRQLARIHSWDTGLVAPSLRSWEYNRELQSSAESTTELYRNVFQAGTRPGGRAMLRSLERVAAKVCDIRAQLVGATGAALLHGDMHSGNVVFRESRDGAQALLLDWGRARLGSPLEDTCSWIHSLAFWEPEARRRHDTLLRTYLEARGMGATLSQTFRDACYLAGACNALAGALRYHLAGASDWTRSQCERALRAGAAADWLRIIRRADACWRR